MTRTKAQLVLVDGYNVIRQVDSLKSAEAKAGLAAGRRALLTTILSSGVLAKSSVVVVFDGSSDVEGNEAAPVSHPSLSIRFSRPPANADAAIVSVLERQTLDEVLLVTADADLAFRARALGARVEAPRSWSGVAPRRLGRRALNRSARASSKDEKPAASKKDVDYWMSVFTDGEKKKDES